MAVAISTYINERKEDLGTRGSAEGTDGTRVHKTLLSSKTCFNFFPNYIAVLAEDSVRGEGANANLISPRPATEYSMTIG